MLASRWPGLHEAQGWDEEHYKAPEDCDSVGQDSSKVQAYCWPQTQRTTINIFWIWRELPLIKNNQEPSEIHPSEQLLQIWWAWAN